MCMYRCVCAGVYAVCLCVYVLCLYVCVVNSGPLMEICVNGPRAVYGNLRKRPTIQYVYVRAMCVRCVFVCMRIRCVFECTWLHCSVLLMCC